MILPKACVVSAALMSSELNKGEFMQLKTIPRANKKEKNVHVCCVFHEAVVGERKGHDVVVPQPQRWPLLARML